MEREKIRIHAKKRNRFRRMAGLFSGMLIISGCGVQNAPKETSAEYEEQFVQEESYDVIICLENEEKTEANEQILLANEQYIFQVFRSSQGTIKTTVPTTDVYFVDVELDVKEKFPEIQENEEYVINVDYEAKTYSITTREKGSM